MDLRVLFYVTPLVKKKLPPTNCQCCFIMLLNSYYSVLWSLALSTMTLLDRLSLIVVWSDVDESSDPWLKLKPGDISLCWTSNWNSVSDEHDPTRGAWGWRGVWWCVLNQQIHCSQIYVVLNLVNLLFNVTWPTCLQFVNCLKIVFKIVVCFLHPYRNESSSYMQF